MWKMFSLLGCLQVCFALRFALFVKLPKIQCLLISPSARCTGEFASVGWIWVWNTLRIKQAPTSPMITQTVPQAFVFRRSRRPSSWISSKGQLQTEAEKRKQNTNVVCDHYYYQKERYSLQKSCPAKSFVYLAVILWHITSMSACWQKTESQELAQNINLFYWWTCLYSLLKWTISKLKITL